MKAAGLKKRGEPFRPFFWIDDHFRIRGWPEATAQALHRPARSALGHHCWEVLGRSTAEQLPERCRSCPMAGQSTPMAPTSAAPGCCAVLPLPGPAHEALVWLPLSQIVDGPSASARLEGLAITGALAERLDSLEGTLDGLRRACGADDCELFLLDASRAEMVLVDCEGADREAFLERTRMPLGAGYPGTVTLQQKPLFTNRLQSDEVFLRTAVKRSRLRSFLGVPLLKENRPIGYVGLGWRNASVPMDWAVRVVEDTRTLITVALRDHKLSSSAAPVAPLEIRCFGSFEILLRGRRLSPASFARRKALELLKILVLQSGTPIHRDQLVELLWPGVAHRRGANRLHGVVSALRSALESRRHKRASEYILCRDDHYLLNTGAPQSIDLHRFLELIATARNAQRQRAEPAALQAFEQAIELYRGELYADDGSNEYFEPHRARLRHAYLDAVRAVSRGKLLSGQIDTAIPLLRAALAFEPVALDLQESLITQLARAGRIGEARRQYTACRTALRQQLDMDLPAQLRGLEKLLY